MRPYAPAGRTMVRPYKVGRELSEIAEVSEGGEDARAVRPYASAGRTVVRTYSVGKVKYYNR